MKNFLIFSIANFVLYSSLSLFAQTEEAPIPRRPSREMPSRPSPHQVSRTEKKSITNLVSTSSYIIIGKIVTIHQGISTFSLPPQCRNPLTLAEVKCLRGSEPTNNQITFFYVGDKIGFSVNDTRIFFGKERDGIVVYNTSLPIDELAQVEKVLNLLPGWINKENQIISPWGEAGIKWPETWKGPKATLFCEKSGRPIYHLDTRLIFKANQVPAKIPKKYQNPYGDGLFTLSISNPTQESIEVPCLLKSGDTILWEDSILVLTERSPFGKIFPKQLPDDLSFVTLAPGETVEGVINTLTLANMQWPNGGDRVYFDFCLGDRRASNFFYYFSALHDAMRK